MIDPSGILSDIVDTAGQAEQLRDDAHNAAAAAKKAKRVLEDVAAHLPNGSGKQFVEWVRSKPVRGRMYIARGFGEAASIIGAPVAMVVVDKGLHQPYEDLKSRVAERFVLPNLEKIDAALSNLKSIDPYYEREERHALPRQEQAKKLTDLLLDQYGVKVGGSLLGQWLSQDYFIRKFNAKVTGKQNLLAIGFDRSVQLGATVLLNTLGADQAVAAQKGLAKILRNVGMSDENAQEWAHYAVNFTAPNALAYACSAELLSHMAKRG
jgi:hypothetical protein